MHASKRDRDEACTHSYSSILRYAMVAEGLVLRCQIANQCEYQNMYGGRSYFQCRVFLFLFATKQMQILRSSGSLCPLWIPRVITSNPTHLNVHHIKSLCWILVGFQQCFCGMQRSQFSPAQTGRFGTSNRHASISWVG